MKTIKPISERKSPEEVAKLLFAEKYFGAKVMFLAGSVLRGEGTDYSDLDLVIVYEKLDFAYRDSYYFCDWPIEAFVHDPETLKYFFEKVDAPSGCPSLPDMVTKGIVIPNESNFSREIKNKGEQLLNSGPSLWDQAAIDRARYAITDLVDDIRSPRNYSELMGTGSKLYEALSDFYFRANNNWSAKGKTISRKLSSTDKGFSLEFEEAFSLLFKDQNPSHVIQLCEKTLRPFGGLLFDGYKLDAPADWRMTDD